jgi:hypothetical protein
MAIWELAENVRWALLSCLILGKGLCSYVSAFGEKTAAKPHSNELYDLRSTGKLVWNQQHNKDSGPTLSLNIELM